MKPVKKKFDSGEHPYNIHSSNIIWNDLGNYKFVSLWKNPSGKVTGTLLQFSNSIKLKMEASKIVVISGIVSLQERSLNPGSLITVNTYSTITPSCVSKECSVYIKSSEAFRVL